MNKVLFGFCIGCLSLCSKGLATPTPISQQKGESPVHTHMGGNNTPMENLQNQNIDFDTQLNNVWESVCRAVNCDKTEELYQNIDFDTQVNNVWESVCLAVKGGKKDNLLNEHERQAIMSLPQKIYVFCLSYSNNLAKLTNLVCVHQPEQLRDAMRSFGFDDPQEVRRLLQKNDQASVLEIKKRLLNFRFFKDKACALDRYLEEKETLDNEIEALGGNV